MTLDEFNHYGYSRRIFRETLRDVSINNFNAGYHLNTWFLAIMAALTLFSGIGVFPSAFFPVYAFFAALSAVCEIASLRIRKYDLDTMGDDGNRIIRTLSHGIMANLLAFGVAASVVDPAMVATSFLVIMVIVAIVFMETMVIMSFRLALFGGILVISSFVTKEPVFAAGDAVNVIIFLAGALILHFMFQREKMGRFITARMLEESRRELKVQSTFDSLTGMLNRPAFYELASSILRDAQNERVAFLAFDLDDFKNVNDSFGHKRGDATLAAVSAAFREEIGMNEESWDFMNQTLNDGSNFAARLGGDEFIIAARGLPNENAAHEMAQRIIDRIGLICVDWESGLYVSASVGIAMSLGGRPTTVDELCQLADERLYKDKRNNLH